LSNFEDGGILEMKYYCHLKSVEKQTKNMDSLDPNASQSQTQVQPVKSHKIHLRPTVWIMTLVVIAFAAGYLVWARANQAWPFDNEIVGLPTHEANTATADWKTYTNTQFGFEFKYPADSKIEFDSSSLQDYHLSLIVPASNNYPYGGEWMSSGISLEISSTSLKNPKDWVKQKYFGSVFDNMTINTTTVSDLSAISVFSAISDGSCSSDFVAFIKNNNVFRFSCYNDDLGKKILSTFKFTK
jgi:hypothetical protein